MTDYDIKLLNEFYWWSFTDQWPNRHHFPQQPHFRPPKYN